MVVFQLLSKMKFVSNCFIIYIFFFLNSSFASNHVKEISCNISLSTNIKNISPLEMTAPREIKIIYNTRTNQLVDYIWNKKSVLEDFELINTNENNKFMEIKKKGFEKKLSDSDIRNGIYFKVNINNLKANLRKMFVRPVNYKCI